jgi:hypothetical protein
MLENIGPNDFALVRSHEDLKRVASQSNLMIIADEDLENSPEVSNCERLVSAPSKFGYLSDGDVIGFDPETGHFRTLYRRASRHNSFLVTAAIIIALCALNRQRTWMIGGY